jgi:hypothetical protein
MRGAGEEGSDSYSPLPNLGEGLGERASQYRISPEFLNLELLDRIEQFQLSVRGIMAPPIDRP